ncbi:MAG: anti sigma factor C-terminal domain-containing protein [Bacillota bacterium]|nr:anti sigma factor C-terminal domain-containing protein [Bacillota bacterium]
MPDKNNINPNEQEEKIDELFNEAKDGKIAKELKRYKIINILRTIAISAVVAIVTLLIAYFVIDSINFQYCQSKQWKKADEIQTYYEVAYPNRYIGVIHRYNNLFSAELECETYKNIGGRIVFAGLEKRLMGLFAIRAGSEWGGMVAQQPTDEDQNKDFKYRSSSVYGLRHLTFFYPYVNYDNSFNDLEMLHEIGNDKIVEMAISFDREYSYKEISKLLPEQLVTFYWVDDKTKNDMKQIQKWKDISKENDVNGIKLINEWGQRIDEPVKSFIIAMERLKNGDFGHNAYKDLYRRIAGHDGELKEDDLRIMGAVLVGSPKELTSLEGMSFIKHAALGTVVDKY